MRVTHEDEYRKQVRQPQTRVRQYDLYAPLGHVMAPDVAGFGGDHALRTAHQEEQIEVDALQVLQLPCAQGKMRRVDHVRGARLGRDRVKEIFCDSAVARSHPVARPPPVEAQYGRGALEVAVGTAV